MINTKCPICERKMQSQTREEWPDWPFCTSRCRLVDLGRWLGEEYRATSALVPEEPLDPDEP